MAINIGTLELTLANLVSVATSTQQLMYLSKAIEKLENGSVQVASTFSALPSATSNVGQLWYVSDTQTVYFASGTAGSWINLLATSSTALWTWGGSAAPVNGQLGAGDATSIRCSPGTIAGAGINWTTISVGANHAGGTKADGTLWVWGQNCSGVLGVNCTGLYSETFCATSPVTTAGGGTTWCQLSSRNQMFAAVKTDGTLWTWGRNYAGVLGNGTTTASQASPATTAGGGTTWCKVSADSHVLAQKTDGTLWAWGYNSKGALGDNTNVAKSSPVSVVGGFNTWCDFSAGGASSFGIRTDGTLWTWGSNGQGQLGNSGGFNTCSSSPGTTTGCGTNWCKVSGGTHVVAVKTDGTLWTWGRNSYGQLGEGSTNSRASPGQVAGGGTTWCFPASGGESSFNSGAIKTDGTLWMWGGNALGKLGDGTAVSKSSPVSVLGGFTNWSCVTMGANVTAGFRKTVF